MNSFFRSGDLLIVISILSGFLMIAINGFLNIYLLQRYFPDKLLPAGIKSLNTFSLIVNILSSVGILVLCVFGATEEFSRHNEGKDPTGLIILVIIFLLWLVQVVVLIMQGQLPGLINRNNRNNIHSLIDSIGK